MTENPYESPQQPGGVTQEPMKLRVGSLYVVAATCVGGLAGMGIGALLGVLVPGYYRSVFAGGDTPHFDPVAVGV